MRKSIFLKNLGLWFLLVGLVVVFDNCGGKAPKDQAKSAEQSKATTEASAKTKLKNGKEVRRDTDVFKRWMATHDPQRLQYVFSDVNLELMNDHLTEDYPHAVLVKYLTYITHFGAIRKLLDEIYDCNFDNALEYSEFVLSNKAKENLGNIYSMLEHDIPGFVKYLKQHGFENPSLNGKENDVLERDYRWMEMLFADENDFQEKEFNYALANRLFEYCFGVATWPEFKQILASKKARPVSFFMYSVMWYNLAGRGWKHWNQEILNALKKEYEKGNKVIYVGGGCDLYQLIKAGVYNIEVLDPMLPSQPRYYADSWEYWFAGQIGDEVVITFDETTKSKSERVHVVLRRADYQELDKFKKNLHTGEDKEITSSETRWVVFDQDTNKKLGCILFNRRLCAQSDFITKPGQVMLISFNELYFLCSQRSGETWGINPDLFPRDFKMFVKQLRRPLSKEIMQNIKRADASSNAAALGSEVD